MAYQPQVDAAGGLLGFEALARWQDEELGHVSPAEFVEVAEKSGLMVPLGAWVLDTSIREFSELRKVSGSFLSLAVNVSVIQFSQPDFIDQVLSALDRYQVSAREVVLEITETLFMSSFDMVVEKLKRLRSEGIRIAMDDFGTGYSSLSLLRRLPIDELKIDKSFVDGIPDDDKARDMIQSIAAITISHHMDLVAEGVEHKEQVDTLAGMGCNHFQGYYFGHPEPMDRIFAQLVQADGCDH